MLRKINQVNEQYSHIHRDRLVIIVHDMNNPERPWMTIHDTPHRSYILKKLKIAYENRVFHLTESELASLEIYFDPEMFDSLNTALAEVKVETSA